MRKKLWFRKGFALKDAPRRGGPSKLSQTSLGPFRRGGGFRVFGLLCFVFFSGFRYTPKVSINNFPIVKFALIKNYLSNIFFFL